MRKIYLTLLSCIAISLFAWGGQSAYAQLTSTSFVIGETGDPSNTALDAFDPDVIYNDINDEFFVVWSGDTLNGRNDIFGQRVNASTGARIGNIILVSTQASPSNVDFDCFDPKVEWNEVSNEYLVVWSGDDSTTTLVDGENEIFGQRVDAMGNRVGNMIRVSFMGTDGDGGSDAFDPEIAYNYIDNNYLVVWSADDSVGGEDEIYGQVLDSVGGLLGSVTRLSFMGPNGSGTYDADRPDLAFNGDDNEYMVVWDADDDTPPQINGETEIFALRVNNMGMPLDSARKISDVGPDGSGAFDALDAEIAWNSDRNEYLVVFQGEDSLSDDADIHGQLLDAAGFEIGDNDFRISNIGPEFNPAVFTDDPSVIYNEECGQYLVAYESDSVGILSVNGENEIYGQRLASDGSFIGVDSLISLAGSALGNGSFDALNPSVGFSYGSGQYIVVYYAEDTIGGLVDGKNEIFGNFVGCCLGPVFDACPLDTIITPSTFDCEVAVSWAEPQAFDGCGGNTVTQDAMPGDLFAVGITTVNYAVSDTIGNTDSCSFDIEIEEPFIPNGVTQTGNQLCATTTAATYQWFLNGSPIAGATSQCYIATQNGNYSVEFEDNGCVGLSEFDNFMVGLENGLVNAPTVFPVPAQDLLRVQFENVPLGMIQIEVVDLTGRVLVDMAAEGLSDWQIDLSTVQNGSYLLRVSAAEGQFVQPIQVLR